MGALIFTVAWLFTRLALIFYDNRLPDVPLGILAAAQVALCFMVLSINPGSISIAVLCVAIMVAHERLLPQRWLNEVRLAGTAILLVANEANLVIRTLFHRFRLEPRLPTEAAATQPGELDQREYNAGRVIGILERWLMYSVVVTSQNYNVIAIIIAAKGIARFRELDRREFAEYVLIGTLASTLLTIIIGETVVRLIE